MFEDWSLIKVDQRNFEHWLRIFFFGLQMWYDHAAQSKNMSLYSFHFNTSLVENDIKSLFQFHVIFNPISSFLI